VASSQGRSRALGEHFRALDKVEQAAVAAYAREECDKLVSLQPPTHTAKHAQADPEGWQDRLRELIARDAKRVKAITEMARSNPEPNG
jgi:hypothetical protein